MNKRSKADYGQDAPLLLRSYLRRGGLFIAGGLLALWAVRRQSQRRQRVLVPFAGIALFTGLWLLARGLVMIWSSRMSKVWAAASLLDELRLQGDETVLDVGCGRGLLLIGAAKRLPDGRAIGIDLWSQVDQGANSKQATLENARIEGVAERVEVLDGDMSQLLLPDASIDVVVASKSIHNIPDREGRFRALQEIVRVLKSGGQVALMDIFCTDEFAADLQALSMQQVSVKPAAFFAYPPLRIVVGRKGLA